MTIVHMLDTHLAEHLDQVSAIVARKYAPAFYSRASIVVREFYLSGRRFAWAAAPSPRRSMAASPSSPPSSPCPSSSPTLSSTPSLVSLSRTSSYSSAWSSDCDEPMTPSAQCTTAQPTTLPPVPPLSQKENLSRSLPCKELGSLSFPPVSRSALCPATWELNVLPVPAGSTYVP
jgi:hypothetical protein